MQPCVHRVVHRAFSARADGLVERHSQRGKIIGERRVRRHGRSDIFVEAQHENFVFRIAVFGKREGRRDDPSAIRAHAAAAVDNQPHGDGCILVAEKADRLRELVLEHVKRHLLEPVHVAVFVAHGHVQYDHLRLGREGGLRLVARLAPFDRFSALADEQPAHDQSDG